MDIQAVAFDVNGTLIDIVTDEGMDEIYRSVRHFLTYQGIDLRRSELRDLYFALIKEQIASSNEAFPEYDAVAIWRRIIDEHETDFTRRLTPEKRAQLPLTLAEMHRGISRKRLELFPNVIETLDALKERYNLAVVTDAQSAYALAELNQVGLLGYFETVIVSGDFGYRKPDGRLFRSALDAIGVAADKAIHIGNDMYRDVHGAREVGMKTVLFESESGDKAYSGVEPDFRIHDYRDLLRILG